MDANWLSLEDGRSALQRDGEPWAILACSPERVAQRCWPHAQPLALDLELAIDMVESAIEAADLHHEPRGSLWVDASLAAQLAPLLAAHPAPLKVGVPETGHSLVAGRTRDEVEAAFSMLVAQVQSGRAVQAPGPSLAALLMLRELMHHLGFARVAFDGG